MEFEIQAEILGKVNFDNTIEVKKHPFTIRVFKNGAKNYISFKKKLIDFENCIPTLKNGEDGIPVLTLPNSDFYSDAIKTIQHIESFGALDNRITSIDTDNLTLRWLPENDNEHVSPLKESTRKRDKQDNRDKLTEKWLQDTVIFESQMGELRIPFAFFRDAENLFESARYQSAFCTFYMMLEYFFNEGSWGIKKDTYKRKPCLNTALRTTLNLLKEFETHYKWLQNELNIRHKEYNEEGLLYVLNQFRDELSHASNRSRNRNVFNETALFSLAFIIKSVCKYVSTKERLAPFVRKDNLDTFFNKDF
jgi:hypothetical protein